MKKIIFCFLLILISSSLSTTLKADVIYLYQYTHHHNCPGVLRDSGPLFIYEKTLNEEDGLMVGYWLNSFNRDTYSIGYHRYFIQEKDFGIGAKVGLVTGYDLPIFAALSFHYKFIDVNYNPTIVTTTFRFKF